jgi:hypothetical protein
MRTTGGLIRCEYYVKRWLDEGDEDALHSLIEAATACLPTVRERALREKSVVKQLRVIEVLREVRALESMKALLSITLHSESSIWKAALEGLAYQNFHGFRSELESLLRTQKNHIQPDKASRILDIINDPLLR